MSELSLHSLEEILKQCAAAAPDPWYPSSFALSRGIPRERLDADLDQLRLGGLLRLTDWVPGHGQGYTLTQEGADFVNDPRQLARLRAAGGVPARPTAPALVPAADNSRPTAWERGEAVRAALFNPTPPVVTLALLFLNILVFLAGYALAWQRGLAINEYLSGNGKGIWEVQHQTGAVMLADIVTDHQYWRLLTCCFVHLGLLHLFVNMFSLYMIGPLVERLWGKAGFLALYLLSGLTGSCAMVAFELGQGGIGAGASGALWGIMASMVAWILLHRGSLPPPLVSRWLRQMLIVILANVLLTFGIKGVSKAAHFGGGAVGLVAAVPLALARFERGRKRWLALAGLLTVPLLNVGLLAYSFNNNALREKAAAQKEELDDHDLYWPKFRDAGKAAQQVYEKLKPLLNEPPAQRGKDPQAVEAALEAIAGAQGQLSEVNVQLMKAGPFRSQEIEHMMQARQQAIHAWREFFRKAGRCLRDPANWTKADEFDLKKSQASAIGWFHQLEKQ
jgi:membrane associated rhomboid family serine protease